MSPPHFCPVCGYEPLMEAPRSPVTGGGSYEICPACGYQFGVDDDDRGIDHVIWRKNWVFEGMPWRSARPQPADWQPMVLLLSLKSKEKKNRH